MQTMTVGEFSEWIISAKHGDSEVYFTGNIAAGRGKNNKELRGKAAEMATEIKATAWLACERGYVSLVQRRVSEGVCAYIAQRTV